MGKFEATRKSLALFLTLVACNYSLQSHGRHIKEPILNQPNVNNNTPLTPSSPVMPNYEVAGVGDDSSAAYTNAFQPTTPGSSPGVGHRSFTQEEDKKVKATVAVQRPAGSVGVSVTNGGPKNEFKPTDPGHSPGVGHDYQHKIGHLY